MEDVEAYYHGKKEVSKKAVCLTFDDGYKNFNTIVKPIIKKYKEAMDTGETKFDYELNNYAIERYNFSGKNKDYLKFTYFDMDKDGQD